MTYALELKPQIHNNEDPYEKNHHFKYWNSQNSNSIVAWGDKMSILELGSVHLELGASYNIKTFL